MGLWIGIGLELKFGELKVNADFHGTGNRSLL